jgi:hypothetical protein
MHENQSRRPKYVILRAVGTYLYMVGTYIFKMDPLSSPLLRGYVLHQVLLVLCKTYSPSALSKVVFNITLSPSAFTFSFCLYYTCDYTTI